MEKRYNREENYAPSTKDTLIATAFSLAKDCNHKFIHQKRITIASIMPIENVALSSIKDALQQALLQNNWKAFLLILKNQKPSLPLKARIALPLNVLRLIFPSMAAILTRLKMSVVTCPLPSSRVL